MGACRRRSEGVVGALRATPLLDEKEPHRALVSSQEPCLPWSNPDSEGLLLASVP